MANAGNSEPTESDAIQFDRAEFTTTPSALTAGAVDCSSCKQPIADSYYELNGQVLCAPCVGNLDAAFLGGSRLLRFLKAGFFGFAAAVGGAILIYLFRAITGLEAAIISILAGYMVGSAVRQGSGYRGGRVYQFMAIFLTYSALSWSYVPEITRELVGHFEKMQDDAAKEKVKENAVAVKDAKQAGNLAQGAADKAPAAPKAAPAIVKQGPGAPANGAEKADPPVSLLMAVLVLCGLVVFLVGITYCAPVLSIVSEMPGGLIALLIVFWGLQQAWKLTRKVSLEFRGPFRVGERRPSQPGVPAHG